ncbi:MAG: alpha/beta hydrolase [Burkholderiales bacterium]
MNARASDAVLLLHGLWMNRFAMCYHARVLKHDGFAAETIGYRSMRDTLDANVRRLAKRVAGLDAPRVHLVGHSMGGVVVLRYLQRNPDARIGRAVLLGAPVAGCRAAEQFARLPGGRLLLGRSMSLWRGPFDTSLDSRHEVGVIAGTRPLGLGRIVTRLPAPNDGVVCLDETRLPGMRDFLVLPLGHVVMLVSSGVARQTAAFLETGAFRR